jgi:hypothetical protein
MTETEKEPAAVPRGSRRSLVVTILAGLFVLYFLSPYYSVWRFVDAIRAHDMEQVTARVDFDAVRGSLKQQIRDHFLGVLAKKKKKDRLAEFLTAAADDPLGKLIDAYVTPEGLAAIISDPAPIKNASSISSLPQIGGDTPQQIDLSFARHAFFTSPREFTVEHHGIKLRFRFNGLGWKLHMLDLQLAAKGE